jgi:hypothetical protein
LENLTAENINSNKIGLPDEQKKQVISLIENAGPELGNMTLGEYTDLIKSPTKAANEVAKEKR